MVIRTAKYLELNPNKTAELWTVFRQVGKSTLVFNYQLALLHRKIKKWNSI